MKGTGVWILAMFQALLAGCATTYVLPTGADLATLTVLNRTGRVASPYTFTNAQTCSGAQRLTKGVTHLGMVPGESMTVPIRAGKDFSLQVWAKDAVSTGYCNIVTTFTPKSGVTYVALASASGRNCHAEIFREVVDAAGNKSFVKELSARRRETKTTLNGQGNCRTWHEHKPAYAFKGAAP